LNRHCCRGTRRRIAIIHHGRLDAGVELIVKPFTQTSLAQKIARVLAQALS
jgi:hypothetical protein